MSLYKDLQIKVYDWLKAKHDRDQNFTFSLRQKANKGAELNYFIGTEKSKYFSTTFWFIPVAYPGSSGDLINLVIDLRKKKIEFFVQFNQTKTPHDKQNRLALEFIRSLKEKVKNDFDNVYVGSDKNKMEFFGAYSTPKYSDFEEMKDDLENMINKIIPMIDEQLALFKSNNPDFIGDKFSKEDQKKMISKMHDRIVKYSDQKYIEKSKGEKKEDEEELFVDFIINPSIPLNQILYGPPGTGKTYNTINKSLAIIEGKTDEDLSNEELNEGRITLHNRFKDYVVDGRIVFTTFHQSMSYEDFIEGIKPEIEDGIDGSRTVIYNVHEGIFKKIAENCKNEHTVSDNYGFTFEDAWESLITKSETNDKFFLNTLSSKEGFLVKDLTENGNLRLTNNLGEKEYVVSFNRMKKLQEKIQNLTVVKNIDKEFREVIGGMNSTAYWSVLNYINNWLKNNHTNKQYIPSNQPCVLIIDEINRGNVSQIFGELITLIEEDKRIGMPEELEIILPYSKKPFGVPSNLYIIGTMNTADRSVEALDSALRRRFVFEEMPPLYHLEDLQDEIFGFKLSDILKRINLRIEKLLDSDHAIGHAYFINKDENAMITSFYKNIIPLLKEYFFGDHGKIGLVLGNGFVQKTEIDSIFADFEYDGKDQYDEKESYTIIDHSDNKNTFEIALSELMK
ncbi:MULTISPECIES: McrB family protein [unclassified Kaistella]|uniref:McrB family protein n=1 Tax=unclassified Kaistella TaxID=2762626 RepID=UPI002732819A|nr:MULTISPECIES: AAA family ATPase [unclassified Kaistella]MDP2453243.1 AAA family ATPase [Kaistella sp. SH11-4b]MDP2456300.1 AAA family ATPase [Kaistella sp. SH40-3]MDP2459056.1 AAA family ATPase [Kaistella sp. SH19-2b]